MISKSLSLARIVSELRRLPGVGEKSALRYVFFLIKHPEIMETMSEALIYAKEHICRCSICCNIAEQDPCILCSEDRDDSTICVVQEPQDILAIERTGSFNGRYHVLHGALSPLNGITPSKLKIAELLQRLDQDQVKEVLIATSFSVEGEATAHYISALVRQKGVKVTRPAHGIPTGSDLEYVDPLTVQYAFSGRQEIID